MFCACLDPIGAFIRVVSELLPRHAQTDQKGFPFLSLTHCVAVFGPSWSRTPIAIRMQTSKQVKQATQMLLEDIHTDTRTETFRDTTRTTTTTNVDDNGVAKVPLFGTAPLHMGRQGPSYAQEPGRRPGQAVDHPEADHCGSQWCRVSHPRTNQNKPSQAKLSWCVRNSGLRPSNHAMECTCE